MDEEESTMRKSTSSTQKKRLREKRSVLGPGISVGEMIGELATMDTLQDVLREEGVDPKEVVKIEHITTLFRSDRPFMIPHTPQVSSNTEDIKKQEAIQKYPPKASGSSNKTGLERETLSELMLSNTWGES